MNKNIKKLRAMTLIELLVVIAIIGILAATVFVAVNSARLKAKDVRVKSNMAQIAVIAKVYQRDHDSTYGEHCSEQTKGQTCDDVPNVFRDPDVIKLMADNTSLGAAWNNGDTLGGYRRVTVNPSAWGLAVELPGEDHMCIDSTGYFKKYEEGELTNQGSMDDGTPPGPSTEKAKCLRPS